MKCAYSKKTFTIIGVFVLIFMISSIIGVKKYRKYRKHRKIIKHQQEQKRQEEQTLRPVSAKYFIRDHANLTYIPVHPGTRLDFKPFPLARNNVTWNRQVIPESFILEIPHGQALEGVSYPIMRHNNRTYVIHELFWDHEKGRRWFPPLPEVCESIPGRVASVTDAGETTYYHWLVDILPKLKLLKDSNVKYDWIYTTLRPLYPFQKRTLEILGIDSRKIINSLDHPYIEADTLIVPSFPSFLLYSPKWVLDFLRNEIIPKINPPTIALSKKVLVSREKSARRRFTNQQALTNRLEALGFKTYFLDDMSFDDQVHLFSNADQIVAPQGTSLANIIFSKPGTAIVEVFQAQEDEVFCYLSQTLGFSYTCVQTVEFEPAYIARSTDTFLTPEAIEAVVYAVEHPPSFEDSPLAVHYSKFR